MHYTVNQGHTSNLKFLPGRGNSAAALLFTLEMQVTPHSAYVNIQGKDVSLGERHVQFKAY